MKSSVATVMILSLVAIGMILFDALAESVRLMGAWTILGG
jgi:hypothetical protein